MSPGGLRFGLQIHQSPLSSNVQCKLYNNMFLVIWLHLWMRAHENSLGDMAAHSGIDDMKDISRPNWTVRQMELWSVVLSLSMLTVRVRSFDGACL